MTKFATCGVHSLVASDKGAVSYTAPAVPAVSAGSASEGELQVHKIAVLVPNLPTDKENAVTVPPGSTLVSGHHSYRVSFVVSLVYRDQNGPAPSDVLIGEIPTIHHATWILDHTGVSYCDAGPKEGIHPPQVAVIVPGIGTIRHHVSTDICRIPPYSGVRCWIRGNLGKWR